MKYNANWNFILNETQNVICGKINDNFGSYWCKMPTNHKSFIIYKAIGLPDADYLNSFDSEKECLDWINKSVFWDEAQIIPFKAITDFISYEEFSAMIEDFYKDFRPSNIPMRMGIWER